MAKNSARKIRSLTAKAKVLGKEVNKFAPYTAMVPYSGAAIRGANMLVQAADSLASLMEAFSDGGSSHPQFGGGQVAGVANNVMVRRTKPTFKSSKGSVRILHKELISTVISNTAVGLSPQYTDSTSVFQVNAGSGTAFPWLASIANSYEFYKFNRVRLVYVPLCATTEIGRVMLGYDPDSTDAIPLDRQALSSMTCSTESSAWGVMSLDLKLSDTNKWYYVDANSTNKNTAYNDQGQFFWSAWSNKDSVTNLGEVYVLYDVTLKDPQPNSYLVDQVLGTGATVTQSAPANAPFFVTSNANTVTVRFLSPGDYLILIACKATASSGFNATTGATILMQTGAVQTGQACVTCKVRVISNFATVELDGLSGLATYEVDITRIPTFAIYNNF